MGMYGYECMLKLSWTNPKCKQSTKGLYRIRIVHTTIGSIKGVWSKRLVRLVQDTFRIGSDLNELLYIGSGLLQHMYRACREHRQHHGATSHTETVYCDGSEDPKLNGFWVMNFGQVTDIQKAMHMSQPCICTGGLKNILTCGPHWLVVI